MEFQRIKLAAATPECIKNREENNVERCEANLEERRGVALGSCDYPLDGKYGYFRTTILPFILYAVKIHSHL